MRVTQFLLAASVALVACSKYVVAATEAGAKMKTPTVITDSALASAEGDAVDDVFVHKMPFKYGNITGTMVVTIDKSSISMASDDSASSDPSSVYDFAQLEKSDSGSDEERGLIEFAATHFAQYKLTEKAVSWVKSIF